jgi:hypothetical protein
VRLPPYAERTATHGNGVDWLSDSAKEALSDDQEAVLRSMRGGHVITVGLGKFGTLGDQI